MLDLQGAVRNLGREAIGDWHRDPWGWPEYGFLLKNPRLVHDQLDADGVSRVALVDVPKENFAARPAMVLDPLDRLAYTALVDYFSRNLIGDLDEHVYGWRLNAEEPVRGNYERNSDEWGRFRHHLLDTAAEFEVLLVTDIVSCFANISVSLLSESLHNVLPDGIPLRRLLGMLEGWDDSSGRAGIPQRSSASAVLANAYLRNLDLVLKAQSKRVGKAAKGEPKRYSWARWMDDMWLFGDDAGALRRAQVGLQEEAEGLGLNLNSSKTELLEGPDAVQRALEMEHSAVDEEIIFGELIVTPDRRGRVKKKKNETPRLDEMIDGILSNRDKVSRTTLRFATTRMRTHRKFRRVPELLMSAHRMPHGADHLARLFRESVGVADFQDWFLEYTRSPWATYEWSTANFGTAIRTSGRRPRKATRDYFAGVLADGRTSLPLFALAAQRLSHWDSDACRLALREAVRTTVNPHHLRIAAFAGLACGEPRTTAKRWLTGSENRLTLEMLEARGFRVPSPTHDYAGDEDS
jgi:hypothetical protein